MESLYHQRIGTPSEVMEEIWDLTNEEVDADFSQAKEVPSVNVIEPERSLQNGRTMIRWILLFLCLWASFCSISDNALEILLLFMRAVFDSLATVFPVVAGFGSTRHSNQNLLESNQRRLEYILHMILSYFTKKFHRKIGFY